MELAFLVSARVVVVVVIISILIALGKVLRR